LRALFSEVAIQFTFEKATPKGLLTTGLVLVIGIAVLIFFLFVYGRNKDE